MGRRRAEEAEDCVKNQMEKMEGLIEALEKAPDAKDFLKLEKNLDEVKNELENEKNKVAEAEQMVKDEMKKLGEALELVEVERVKAVAAENLAEEAKLEAVDAKRLLELEK